MSTASSRNALDGAPIQRVTIYDGGGTPASAAFLGSAVTAASPASAVVTASSAQVIAAQSARIGLVLTHMGTSGPISISFGATTNLAVLNAGLSLAQGAQWSMDNRSFTTAAVNAIAASSGPRLSIQEWTT